MDNRARLTGAGTGTNIVGLLGIAFVVLKLTGFITWSWWLVLLPFYGGLVLLAVILLLAGLFALAFRRR
jgi:hypothetical protein